MQTVGQAEAANGVYIELQCGSYILMTPIMAATLTTMVR
jgi:hypothetical protein